MRTPRSYKCYRCNQWELLINHATQQCGFVMPFGAWIVLLGLVIALYVYWLLA